MTETCTSNSTPPWYRQFWPWFIISLPATAVIASLYTVYIAFTNIDDLVNDNYYKDGLAINRHLAQDEMASQLGLEAVIVVDKISGEIFADLTYSNLAVPKSNSSELTSSTSTSTPASTNVGGETNPPDQLELLLLHPMNQQRDTSLALTHISNGHYRADLNQLPQQRYYLRLQSVDGDLWRLNGEMDFSTNNRITLRHND